MILDDSLSFLMLPHESLIQNINVKLLKVIHFLLTGAYEKNSTSVKKSSQSKLKLVDKKLIHQRIS